MANKLEGVAAMTKALNELGARTAAKELRGTARAAMKIVHEKAMATMPVGAFPHTTYRGRRVFGGFSKRNLKLATRINKYSKSVEAIVGPSREAFYATQFVELGTSKMPARPWLRPAFESSQDAVLSEISSQLRKRIARLKR
jgi:HK97 gp10 family phage protein